MWQSIKDIGVFFEQVSDSCFHHRETGVVNIRRIGKGGFCGLPCFFHNSNIHGQIGGLELRQTVLAAAEEIAGTAERQIFFCNFEAIICFAQGFQSSLGFRIFIVGE